MSQVSGGIRAVLARPEIYELWSRAVGGVRGRRTLVRDHVRPGKRARILDLGCGPGDLVRYLPPEVQYVGLDLSRDYIASARARFGDQNHDFHIGDVAALNADLGTFDIVMAFGLVHHLDDHAAHSLFRQAATALTAGGRIVTVDPVFTATQSVVAHAVIARDRGQNVRTAEAYKALATDLFPEVTVITRSDLLRIPYTHCVLEGRAGAS